jgi:hypothetical protein
MPSEDHATLIGALATIEASLVAIEAARTTYAVVSAELHKSAFSDPRNHAQERLAAAITLDRLDILIAARIRKLELGAILDSGISGARVEDFNALTAKINELVP